MSASDAVPVAAPFRGHTCRELYKAIYEADYPEQVVRQLPAQSLFMVIKQVGLTGAADLISMASLDQCRLLTDFDIWQGGQLNEERLWEWLSLTDETDSLELLQKALKFIDLKVLAVLIGRYVEVKVLEEPTDEPPGPGFHTPDKGFTWVGIKAENPEQHFLLARLLALIFESSVELFYQLLATPAVATPTMLEEESYQERNKRLASEGVPEVEVAAALNAPYAMADARNDLEAHTERPIIEDIRSIEPLVYEARATKLFAELMRRVSDHETVEMEFTYIMNAAVVRWGVDFSEQAQVLLLAEKVKGAINIGLERLLKATERSVRDIYEALGLGKIYRLGLTELLSLRNAARRIDLAALEAKKDDKIIFATVACAREAFPEMPIFLNDDGTTVQQDGQLQAGQRAIESVLALESIRDILNRAEEPIKSSD